MCVIVVRFLVEFVVWVWCLKYFVFKVDDCVVVCFYLDCVIDEDMFIEVFVFMSKESLLISLLIIF